MGTPLPVAQHVYEIAFLLKRKRLELGLTQKQFAKLVGVQPYVVANLEIGEIPHVRLSRLQGLAAFLQIPAEHLNPEARELQKSGKGGRWPRPGAGSVHKDEVDEEIEIYDRPLRRGDCLSSKQRYTLLAKRATFSGTPVPKEHRDGGDGYPDGINCARPCPFVSCKHHLFVDVSERTGGMKMNFPQFNVWDLSSLSVEELNAMTDDQLADMREERGRASILPSCSLDVSDAGPITLEKVGDYFGVTRERARQLEDGGMRKLKAWAVLRGEALKEYLEEEVGPMGHLTGSDPTDSSWAP